MKKPTLIFSIFLLFIFFLSCSSEKDDIEFQILDPSDFFLIDEDSYSEKNPKTLKAKLNSYSELNNLVAYLGKEQNEELTILKKSFLKNYKTARGISKAIAEAENFETLKALIELGVGLMKKADENLAEIIRSITDKTILEYVIK